MAQMGDVTQIRIGPQKVAVLTNPDDIKNLLVTNQRNFTKGRGLESTKALLGEGMLTSEGEFHLRQRRLAQPAFHRDRIANYAQVMGDYTERTQREWRNGETRDVHEDMMHLTLAIAGKTLFDADVENDAKDVGEAMELSLKMFNYTVLPLGFLMEYAPFRWVRALRGARRRMNEIIFGLIDERRANPTDRGDLLSMLMAATDLEGDGTGMSNIQLRDELVTIILAAHETTAVALSWTWYLLSQNPAVEARLHAEVDALGGRRPTMDDLGQLPYTRQVFSEAMRLYPPAWTVERRAINDFEAGGYTIKGGTIVLASQYLMHRDPRYWENPDQFDPDRWTTEAVAKRHKFTYFPFGAGTRVCIGEQFAWMEGILILAGLSQRWKMRLAPGHVVEKEALVTLRPKYGMRMQLEQR